MVSSCHCEAASTLSWVLLILHLNLFIAYIKILDFNTLAITYLLSVQYTHDSFKRTIPLLPKYKTSLKSLTFLLVLLYVKHILPEIYLSY